MRKHITKEVDKIVEERILDLLLPPIDSASTDQGQMPDNPLQFFANLSGVSQAKSAKSETENTEHNKQNQKNDDADYQQFQKTRGKLRKKLQENFFEDKEIEMDIQASFPKHKAFFDLGNQDGMEQIDTMMKHLMKQFNRGSKRKKITIKDARKILREQEIEKLLNIDLANENAIKNTENMGIVFLDEIDKVASKSDGRNNDISREGVQRDLLPLVEGCTVNTKYGPVKTDHILFIAAGAFHISSPSDIIPELQGRFPIRVELESLGIEDLEKILTKPKNALINQYKALLQTENVSISFKRDALKTIAKIANNINQTSVNIGARRLATIMEKLLEDILFHSPNVDKNIAIDANYVNTMLNDIIEDEDTSKYIL